MNPNEKLYDIATSHQIGVQRHGTAILKKILTHLEAVERDTVAKLAGASAFTKRDLEGFLAFIRARAEIYRQAIRGELQDEMTALANYEAEFEATKMSAATGAVFNRPSPSQVSAVVASAPFQGRIMRDWADDLANGVRNRLQDAITIGVTEGESIDKLVRRVRGTRANGFKDGVIQASRRDAEAVVRTAANHIATSARALTVAQNPDLFEGVVWSAVLDARTSSVCRARDGEIYPLDSGPRPPAHWNCRSTVVPILKGVDMPKRPTYAEWLKKQPFSEQVEILGPARAALFRAGGLPIDRFVDSAGRAYTLDELRKRDRAAFERAGLTKG